MVSPASPPAGGSTPGASAPDVAAAPRRHPPARALLFSVLSLAVPVAATLWSPAWAEGDGAVLIWVPALLPPFLLAYYRGWTGASLALAGGMAALAVAQVGALLLALPAPPYSILFGVVALLVVVSVGAGGVAELLHRDREVAERASLTDPLTGLHNRRHATTFLSMAWGTFSRGQTVTAILFDLDHFKWVNDAQGHAEGDRVLREVGAILEARTRASDLAARFGGEEFLVVLIGCDGPAAEDFAEEVRERVASIDLGWGRVTVSAGISVAEPDMGGPEVLVAAADRALYQAKERGRNRVVRLTSHPRVPEAPTTDGLPSEAPQGLDGIQVVLVDDDDLTLRSTARLLGRLGCEVRATASPREALGWLSAGIQADLLVTDIVMPDMSGFSLVDLASKDRPGLPVLYISGYPREEVYWGGTPGVRSAFMAKPLEAEELRASLLGLLTPRGGEGARSLAEMEEPHEGPPPKGRRRAALSDAEAYRGQILIVDDDSAVVRTLQKLFARAGYPQPLGVTDPRDVTDVLRNEEVDLLILDLVLGEVDGFDVLETVTRLTEGDEFFPVVVITGNSDPRVRNRALAAGAMDFLAKPLDPTEARTRVRNLLATRFLTKGVSRERDSLEEVVATRTAELADTRSEILYRLARAAEYRDDVTGRHAERVGLLSSAIAAELGLPPKQTDLLRRTAPLHDIGKIGVPDAILLKRGRLTPAEFEVMKSHTTIGAQILGGSRHRILEVARDIALSHHERWDGTGYPEGAASDAIPLEARIVAVADSFDTISHARPYKAALSPEAALAEVIRCRGSHYDPAVVDALTAVRDQVGLSHMHEIGAPLDPQRDADDDPRL